MTNFLTTNDLKMTNFSTTNDFMTPDEASQYLKVKKSTLYNWTMRKMVPVVKLGRLSRYRKADMDFFINSNVIAKNVS